jgi:hypothetical protein
LETDYNIYGGISWLSSGPISLVCYPSGKLFSETGVVVSGYAQERGSEFGALPTTESQIAASRAAIELLHPGHGKELLNPIYVNWGKMPWNLGGWIGRNYYEGPYKESIEPDGRIHFAGDHVSHISAWQEGAVLSAHRAIQMICDRVRESKTTKTREALLLNRRIHVAGGPHAIRIGAHAEVIHVVGDPHPAMANVRRNDDDVARLHFNHLRFTQLHRAAGARSIEDRVAFVVLRDLLRADHRATRDHGPGTLGDDVIPGLVMVDQARPEPVGPVLAGSAVDDPDRHVVRAGVDHLELLVNLRRSVLENSVDFSCLLD